MKQGFLEEKHFNSFTNYIKDDFMRQMKFYHFLSSKKPTCYSSQSSTSNTLYIPSLFMENQIALCGIERSKIFFQVCLTAARQSLPTSPMWRRRKYSLCLQAHFLSPFGYLHLILFREGGENAQLLKGLLPQGNELKLH